MKRLVAIASLGSLLLVAGVTGAHAQAKRAKRPASVKRMVDYALHKLAIGDDLGFLVLAPTLKEMKRYCQKMPVDEKAVTKLHAKIVRGIERCRQRIDFSRAKLMVFRGGKRKRRVKECNGVWTLTDIEIRVRVGNEDHTLVLDDPYVLNGTSFGVTDGPHCRGRDVKPPSSSTARPATKAP